MIQIIEHPKTQYHIRGGKIVNFFILHRMIFLQVDLCSVACKTQELAEVSYWQGRLKTHWIFTDDVYCRYIYVVKKHTSKK